MEQISPRTYKTKMELKDLHDTFTLEADRELRKVLVAMNNYPDRIADLQEKHDRIKKMVNDLEEYRKLIDPSIDK